MNDTDVCVVIAAYRAQATIGRAITSALAEPETVEVIVVVDASPDDTAAAARAADDGSGRLSVIEMPANGGPSRARNHAIAVSRAPLIAVLDADDFFLPGRLASLVIGDDWDLSADNIAFVGDRDADRIDPAAIEAGTIPPFQLTAAQFAEESITRPDRYRGELAFLKPVMRRTFLDRYGLRYDEQMRLAEDYDLYMRALLAGARFRIVAACRYVAVERWGSLSHHHRADDLARFETAIRRFRATAAADTRLRRALDRHHRQTATKWHHQALLERKREVGIVRALIGQARTPLALATAMRAIARDKIASFFSKATPPPERETGVRFLIEPS